MKQLLILLLILLSAGLLPGQDCQVPINVAQAAGNILTPEQEMQLGEIIAEHVARSYPEIESGPMVDYLRRVGNRVAKEMKFPVPPQFVLVDLPEVQAYSFVGGRILVTRKLVAFLESEDELAAVLGHELGHLVTREPAANMSRMFRELLKIGSFKDRRELYEAYHQIIESVRIKKVKFSRKAEDRDQIESDRIGIYLAVRAGYAPDAAAKAFDRLLKMYGSKSSWLGDIFGRSTPDVARLREAMKSVETLPAPCKQASPANPADFLAWKKSVESWRQGTRLETLPGLMKKTTLTPPLEPDFWNLRFSSDGKYILAQDAASIYVVQRDTMEPLFRIPAEEAFRATFSPDQQSVVFYFRSGRVERWSIAKQRAEQVEEFFSGEECLGNALAPDGSMISCYSWKGDLILSDVASATEVWRKKAFYYSGWEPGYHYRSQFMKWSFVELVEDSAFMEFSPDGHYFAAGNRGEVAVAWDLQKKDFVPLSAGLKRLLATGFHFAGSERVIGHERLATFPAGEELAKFSLDKLPRMATSGDYMVLPVLPADADPKNKEDVEYHLGIAAIPPAEIIFATPQRTLDVYGDEMIIGARTGEIALANFRTQTVIGTAVLPQGPLGSLQAVAVAPDFSQVALSGLDRGGVWNLGTNQRVVSSRGFQGAFFADGKNLVADLRKQFDAPRKLARFDLSSGAEGEMPKLNLRNTWQFGNLLLTMRPKKLPRDWNDKQDKFVGVERDGVVEVRDVVTEKIKWTRDFPNETPDIFLSTRESTALFLWTVQAARTQVDADPRLSLRAKTLGDREGDYYAEVLDANTGTVKGKLLVETGKGSFRVRDVFAFGDWVMLSDDAQRVLMYSLSTGELKARFFGDGISVSPAAQLLCIEPVPGRLVMIDLNTLERKAEYRFAAEVVTSIFSDDGKKMFVLTVDQTTYVIDLTKSGSPVAAR